MHVHVFKDATKPNAAKTCKLILSVKAYVTKKYKVIKCSDLFECFFYFLFISQMTG